MSGSLGQPAQCIAELEPVLILSHSYTYYAPREILAVPLAHPMAVTLGSAVDVNMDVDYQRVHIRLAEIVEDKVEGDDSDDGRTVKKRVPIGDVHAAIVLINGKLYYKHLGDQPSIVASKRADARVVQKPGLVIPLEFGQSVGMGATEDVFGQPMWWYYVRCYPLRYLRRQMAAAVATGSVNRHRSST